GGRRRAADGEGGGAEAGGGDRGEVDVVGGPLDGVAVGPVGADVVGGPGEVDLGAGDGGGLEVRRGGRGGAGRGDQAVDHQEVVRVAGAGAEVDVAVGHGRHLELDRRPQGVAVAGDLAAVVQLDGVAVGAVGAELVGAAVHVPDDAVGIAVGRHRGRRAGEGEAVRRARLGGGVHGAVGDAEGLGRAAVAFDVVDAAVVDGGGVERAGELVGGVL